MLNDDPLFMVKAVRVELTIHDLCVLFANTQYHISIEIQTKTSVSTPNSKDMLRLFFVVIVVRIVVNCFAPKNR